MFWTDALIDVLLVLFVIVSLLMCLVVLMQRSKQEGLGAAFGGGFTDSVFGAQTSNVLVKATVYLAALFFIFSIALARLYSHRAELASQAEGSTAHQMLLHAETPASAAVPLSPAAPATLTNAPAATTTPTAPVNTPAAATPTTAAPAASTTNAPATVPPATPAR